MNMFEISPKKNWKRITTIVFIFLFFVTTFLFAAIYEQFTRDHPDREMLINVSAVWIFLFLIFLGTRFRYRQAKKKEANKIKNN